MRRRVVVFGLAMCLMSVTIPAFSVGNTPVTGTVRDYAGSPLPNVLISRSTTYTVTNASGYYSLDVPVGSNFSLTAQKTGLVAAYRSATAVPRVVLLETTVSPGTTVDFNMHYTLRVSVSPVRFNNSPPKTLTITAKSFAPGASCATWTDQTTGTKVDLVLSESVSGGESTWTGTYPVPTGTPDATYPSTTLVAECSTLTALTPSVTGGYIVDSSSS